MGHMVTHPCWNSRYNVFGNEALRNICAAWEETGIIIPDIFPQNKHLQCSIVHSEEVELQYEIDEQKIYEPLRVSHIHVQIIWILPAQFVYAFNFIDWLLYSIISRAKRWKIAAFDNVNGYCPPCLLGYLLLTEIHWDLNRDRFYIHTFIWGMIAHPCPSFDGSLTK